MMRTSAPGLKRSDDGKLYKDKLTCSALSPSTAASRTPESIDTYCMNTGHSVSLLSFASLNANAETTDWNVQALAERAAILSRTAVDSAIESATIAVMTLLVNDVHLGGAQGGCRTIVIGACVARDLAVNLAAQEVMDCVDSRCSSIHLVGQGTALRSCGPLLPERHRQEI